MKLSTSWHEFIAQMGDEPGLQRGVVTVYVSSLHGADRAFTVPSADVTVCAEQGCLVGVGLTLPGGRRLFVPGANVVAILDGDVSALTLLK